MTARKLRGKLRRRAGVIAVATALVLLVASPAMAVVRDDGDRPGDALSAGFVLLVFVGAPLAMFVVIALLVMAPSWVKGPRYRPGLGWWAAPVWFNGSNEDIEAAVAAAPRTTGGGGTSARW